MNSDQHDPSTNVMHLDVHTQARIGGGSHSIYIHYRGVLKVDEADGKVLGWAPGAKSSPVWRSRVVFSTRYGNR